MRPRRIPLILVLCATGCFPKCKSSIRSSSVEATDIQEFYRIDLNAERDTTYVRAWFAALYPDDPSRGYRNVVLVSPSRIEHDGIPLRIRDEFEPDAYYDGDDSTYVASHVWRWTVNEQISHSYRVDMPRHRFLEVPGRISRSKPIAIRFEPPVQEDEAVAFYVTNDGRTVLIGRESREGADRFVPDFEDAERLVVGDQELWAVREIRRKPRKRTSLWADAISEPVPIFVDE
ncbi:MAG: hypothetical protein AAGD14_13320 [Planctomycetota bacterium]